MRQVCVTALLLLLAMTAEAQVPRHLGSNGTLSAEIDAQSFRCENVRASVFVAASSPEAFTQAKRPELLAFLNAVRERNLTNRCPAIVDIGLFGTHDGRGVYNGAYFALFRPDGAPVWVLVDQLEPGAATRRQSATPGARDLAPAVETQDLVFVAPQDFLSPAFRQFNGHVALMVSQELLGRRLRTQELQAPGGLPEPLETRVPRRSAPFPATPVNISRDCFSVRQHAVRPCIAVVSADHLPVLLRGLDAVQHDFLVVHWAGPAVHREGRTTDALVVPAQAAPTPTPTVPLPVAALTIPASGATQVFVSHGPLRARVPAVVGPWNDAREVLAQLTLYGVTADRLEATLPHSIVGRLGPERALGFLQAELFRTPAADALFAPGNPFHLYVARPEGLRPVRVQRADGRFAGRAEDTIPFNAPPRLARAALARTPPFVVLASRTPIGQVIGTAILARDDSQARQMLSAQAAQSGVTYGAWQQVDVSQIEAQLSRPGSVLQIRSDDLPGSVLDFLFREPAAHWYVTGAFGIAPLAITAEAPPPMAAVTTPPQPGFTTGGIGRQPEPARSPAAPTAAAGPAAPAAAAGASTAANADQAERRRQRIAAVGRPLPRINLLDVESYILVTAATAGELRQQLDRMPEVRLPQGDRPLAIAVSYLVDTTGLDLTAAALQSSQGPDRRTVLTTSALLARSPELLAPHLNYFILSRQDLIEFEATTEGASDIRPPDEAALERHRTTRPQGFAMASDVGSVRAMLCTNRVSDFCVQGPIGQAMAARLDVKLGARLTDPQAFRRLMANRQIAIHLGDQRHRPEFDFLYGGQFALRDHNGATVAFDRFPVPIPAQAKGTGASAAVPPVCDVTGPMLIQGGARSRVPQPGDRAAVFQVWQNDPDAVIAAALGGYTGTAVLEGDVFGLLLRGGIPLIISGPGAVYSPAGIAARLPDLATQCAQLTVVAIRPQGR